MFLDLFKQTKEKIPTSLDVLVFDHKEKQFAGEVDSIKAQNEKGPLSLLPGHTNFISIIKDELVLNTSGGQTKNFTFETGILRCFNSKIDVYLGIELDIEQKKG